ncbi:MAG: hypothetical protein ACXVSE_00390 [Solirubrobacteraceae bacterium]
MDPRPVSLFDVVKRAAQVVDPDDEDAIVGDFQRAFEDDDEPVAGLDVQDRVADVLSQLDPAVNNGSLSVAAAITVYLSYRRDEVGAEPRELIRLAARAEWDDDPPEAVVEWLDDHNVTL